jgi:hypothetical protein
MPLACHLHLDFAISGLLHYNCIFRGGHKNSIKLPLASTQHAHTCIWTLLFLGHLHATCIWTLPFQASCTTLAFSGEGIKILLNCHLPQLTHTHFVKQFFTDMDEQPRKGNMVYFLGKVEEMFGQLLEDVAEAVEAGEQVNNASSETIYLGRLAIASLLEVRRHSPQGFAKMDRMLRPSLVALFGEEMVFPLIYGEML